MHKLYINTIKITCTHINNIKITCTHNNNIKITCTHNNNIKLTCTHNNNIKLTCKNCVTKRSKQCVQMHEKKHQNNVYTQQDQNNLYKLYNNRIKIMCTNCTNKIKICTNCMTIKTKQLVQTVHQEEQNNLYKLFNKKNKTTCTNYEVTDKNDSYKLCSTKTKTNLYQPYQKSTPQVILTVQSHQHDLPTTACQSVSKSLCHVVIWCTYHNM